MKAKLKILSKKVLRSLVWYILVCVYTYIYIYIHIHILYNLSMCGKTSWSIEQISTTVQGWCSSCFVYIMSMGNPGSNRWRYVSTIVWSICSGDIPWNLGLKNRPYIWDWYLQFRILNFPLKKYFSLPVKFGDVLMSFQYWNSSGTTTEVL